METDFARNSPGKSSGRQEILLGGFVAGTLDLIAAFINSGLQGVSPNRVLQAIAAGLLGAESLKGGSATAALGIFLHYVIAFGAAAVFFLASRKINFLTDQPVISGILYGIAVYLVMSFIVVPLSAFPFPMPLTLHSVIINVLIHIFCVGLPIALVTRRYSR
jgi:hypothetical protein